MMPRRLRQLGDPYARSSGAADRVAARMRRGRDRAWLRRTGHLDGLRALAGDVRSGLPVASGPRVLVVSLRAWLPHAGWEATLAQALRLRGADVGLLTCGGGQPICELGWPRRAAPRPCDRCGWFTDELARDSGLHHFRIADYSSWTGQGTPEQLARPGFGVQAAAETAWASAAWFIKRSVITEDPEDQAVARDYTVSAMAVHHAAERILDRFRPDVVFSLNGLFAAERALRQAARQRGIACPVYEVGMRNDSLVLSHDAPAPYLQTDALWSDARDRPLSSDEDAALERLLEERATGGAPMTFFGDADRDAEALRRSLRLTPGRRIATAFSNLSWDTAVLDRNLHFSSQFEWLSHAVRVAERQPDLDLVIRAHPAERRFGTAEPVAGEMMTRFARLPDNVRLVAPEEPISSYALMDISDIVLTYNSTAGVEAAARGVPVGVCAAAHYRGRGFTHDVESDGDLEALLSTPQRPLSPQRADLARRYAFAFFFRLMIPFPSLRRDHKTGGFQAVPTTRSEIEPGRDPYLDFVCDRVCDGGDFFLPRELVSMASA